MIDYNWPNLVAMLFGQAEKNGDKPLFWAKKDGEFVPMSWRESADQVSALAAALISYGLAPGDRVILLSHNSPNWAIADFAIMAAGGVTVPAYTTNTTADHVHILADSGATMAIVSDPVLASGFIEAARETAGLKHIVMVEDSPDGEAGGAVISTWSQALEDGRDMASQIVAETPGQEATKRYAESLARLPVDGQVALLRGLAGRGDRADFRIPGEDRQR